MCPTGGSLKLAFTHMAKSTLMTDSGSLRKVPHNYSFIVHLPQWFDQIRFVSFDAAAPGARVPARG